MKAHLMRALRYGGLILVLLVALFTLRHNLPDLGQTLTTLRNAHVSWLVLAALAELVSLRHFALQQRRLLAGFGVDMSVPRAVAVTYSRSALSFSLPAGSAVSAGFAFRQFRTAGASRRAAAAVTVLSGVLSGLALLLMYGAIVLIPPGGATNDNATLVLVLTTFTLALLVFAADWWFSRSGHAGPHTTDDDEDHVEDEKGVRAWVRRLGENLRAMPRRAWILSLAHATVNWALDFACLAATAEALDIEVSLVRLATVYLTVQLVRQIPLTPGGIGVIEVTLLAGLVSAGAPEAAAAAAMLLYRLISCWMIIPLGAIAYAVLQRARPDDTDEGSTTDDDSTTEPVVARPER